MADPYANETDTQPQGGFSPAGVVGGYYQWKYLQNPWTYSGTKGIKTPFGISPTKESWSAYTSAFKEAKGFKGKTGALWSNFKKMKSAGGGRIGGNYSPWNKSYQSAKLSRNNIPFQDEAWIQEDLSQQLKVRQKLKNKFSKIIKKKTRHARLNELSTPDLIEKQIREQAARMNLLRQGLQDDYTKLASKKVAMRSLKWGIRGMKAVSAVGMLWLAADVGMMVGEPIGRAVINQVNSLMERAENRFMPETGGRLNMAYLSMGAATERQRAVQAISKGYINGRSAYGSEASLMHS